MVMIQNKKVKFARIILTNEAIIVEGADQSSPIKKNNKGFNATFPFSQIRKAYKSKFRALHVFKIETIDDNFYIITFGGMESTLGKKKAIQLGILAEQAMSGPSASKSNQFCTNCGEKIDTSSNFCGKCGKRND